MGEGGEGALWRGQMRSGRGEGGVLRREGEGGDEGVRVNLAVRGESEGEVWLCGGEWGRSLTFGWGMGEAWLWGGC